MVTTRFWKNKEDAVQYVEGILTRSDQDVILQSITITKLEKLEDSYATVVIMSLSEGSSEMM